MISGIADVERQLRGNANDWGKVPW